MKVLIVDDNSENLYLLESILKGSGYITVPANNGAEALALARKDIPDLIITDILMPVMDGFTLCREFKNDEKLCSVPFIFYTATYSDPRDEEFALRLGADRFILKPRDPEEFIAIVKDLLKEEKKKNIIKTEAPSTPETIILKEYNEVLVRKLEAKMLKLEQSEKEIRKNNILLLKEIEGRKRTEKLLQESEERFKQISENAKEMIWEVDNGGLYIYVSPVIKELLGYEVEEIVGIKHFYDLFDPEIKEDLKQAALGAFARKESFRDFTNCNIHKDGRKIILSTSGIPVVDNEDNLIGYRGVDVDITERKLMEDELRESEARLNEAMQIAMLGTWEYDVDSEQFKFNDQFYKIMHTTAEREGGYFMPAMQYAQKFVHPDDISVVGLETNKALETTDPNYYSHLDHRIIFADGDEGYVSVNIRIDKDSLGRTVKTYGVNQNITERKLSTDALGASEAKFRSYVDYSPQGIFVVNAKGQYIDANEAALNQIGCSREYLMQKTIADILPKEELEKGLNHFNKLMKEGKAIGEFRLLKTNGEQINVILDTVKISDDQFLGFSTNITERKQAERLTVALYGISRAIYSTDYIDDFYQHIHRSLSSIIPARNFFIALLTKDEKTLHLSYNSDEKDSDESWTIDADDSQSLTIEVLRSKRPLLLNEKELNDRYSSGKNKVWGTAPKCWLGVPLIIRGKAIGVIVVQDYDMENVYSQKDISLFETAAGQIAIAIDRKRSEEALRDSEERYRSLIQSANDAIITTDDKGTILSCNPGMQKIFGFTEGEITGKQLSLIIPPVNSKQHNKEMKLIGQGGEHPVVGKTIEMLGIHKNGNVFPIELSLAKWETSSSKFFTGIVRDISARKGKEKEIVMLANALRSVDQCVSITDMEDKIIFINQSFLRTYGYREDEIIGKDMSVFRSQKNPPALIEEILPSTLSGGWNGELWNKRKDGTEFLISLSTRLIEDKDDKFFGLIGVASDITERKRVESELIAAKEKAEEMNRLKSNFLANMSHELRTPLVGILGFSDILRQDVESHEIKAMAETIFKSGKRLSETLNLILDLSRLETEKTGIKYQKVDLVNKAKEIITLFSETAMKKGLSLVSSFSQDSIIINFDERAFNSILNNLINNALKYTIEGSVTTSIFLNGDHVEIKVIDTGIGIAEQDYQIIFEEFRQASEGYSRNFEGSGLGLSITKKLVEKFGGTISVESEIGKGSSFNVILPIINLKESRNELTESENKIISKLPELVSIKPLALLVDDDPFVFTILKRYAIEYFELDSTLDAEFAIEMLQKKHYDLIFMDINLSRGMDGKEATKKIRTMEGYESIPIIATTAYTMLGDKEEFLAAGCSHYLSKPFNQQDVVELLDKVLKLV